MNRTLKAPLPNADVADLPGFVHRYAHVNGTRLHYVVGGGGPKVALLHGFPLCVAVLARVDAAAGQRPLQGASESILNLSEL